MRKKIVIAAVAGQLVGLLGWIDATYVPFVLVGPLVVGAVAAARQLPLVPVMVLWASAGLNMLWTDWLVNREDVGFHAVLAVIMAAARRRRLGDRHRDRETAQSPRRLSLLVVVGNPVYLTGFPTQDDHPQVK